MGIYLKQYPISIDLVWLSTNPAEKKEIHKICRKHIKGYEGYRLNKELDQVEFYAEQDFSDWDLEKLYQELESWAFSLEEKPDDLDDVSKH